MITAQLITDVAWEACQPWWTTAWTVPQRVTHPRRPVRGLAFFDSDDVLIGVCGLDGDDRLPPRTVALRLAMDPARASQWELHACLTLAVKAAFGDGSAATEIVGTCARADDVPALLPTWCWLADNVTRDNPDVVAAGGWWHDMPDGETDPDKSRRLFWHWIKRRPEPVAEKDAAPVAVTPKKK